MFPAHLVRTYKKDIEKFGRVLRIVRRLELVFALVPVRILLRLFFFSRGFGDQMVYTLMALFLGTGNQTANVSSATLERLFTDANMKLWDYSPETLLANLPRMYTFPKLGEFYQDWARDLRGKGVHIRLGQELVQVVHRGKHVTLDIRRTGSKQRSIEQFDELVLAVLADDAKRLLGTQGRWMERNVLGSVSFYDDVTVTHTDHTYFQKYYETAFRPELVASGELPKAQQEQVEFARDHFRPMYYTHTYAQDPARIEMSFDCSNYQHQLPKKDWPIEQHIFQTIFLDKNSEELWTKDESNRRRHRDCAEMVAPARPPVAALPQSRALDDVPERQEAYLVRRLLDAGRMLPYLTHANSKNMHELACVSGLAVAYHRLGAAYPCKDDGFSLPRFSRCICYLLSHGTRYKADHNSSTVD